MHCNWLANWTQPPLTTRSDLATVCRDKLALPSAEQRAKQADQIIEDLVAVNPESADAWFARYLYRSRYPQSDELSEEWQASLDADLDRAIELDKRSQSRNVHILVAEAERFRRQGEWKAAWRCTRRLGERTRKMFVPIWR